MFARWATPIDYRFVRYLSTRGPYRYIWSLTEGDPHTEHSGILELTGRVFAGAAFVFIDATVESRRLGTERSL
jgi:hypothetical protein